MAATSSGVAKRFSNEVGRAFEEFLFNLLASLAALQGERLDKIIYAFGSGRS